MGDNDDHGKRDNLDIEIVAIEPALSPSQWFAETTDGREIYIIYKIGYIDIRWRKDHSTIVIIDNVPHEIWADLDYVRKRAAEYGIMIPERTKVSS